MEKSDESFLSEINKEGVSLIIGARDEEKTVALTIGHLVEEFHASGLDRWEIILMDNASLDETSRFFAWKLGQKVPRDKYIYSPRGLVTTGKLRIFYDPVPSNVGTRNNGARWARYENLIFADAHIITRPGTLVSTLKALHTYGGIIHAPVSWLGADPSAPDPSYQYSYKVGEKIWGCVDEETELLTEDGWKKYNDVKKGMKISTINLKTQEIEIQPVKDLTVWDFDDKAVFISGRDVSFLLTPDHRCITKKGNSFEITRASEINHNSFPTKNKGFMGKKTKHDDALVEVIGWIVTEGNFYTDTVRLDRGLDKHGKSKKYSYTYPRIQIVQKNNTVELERALDESRLSYFKMKRKDGCTVYRLNRKSGYEIQKIIPTKELNSTFIFSLNRRQLEKLYHVLIISDGHKDKHGSEVFYQVNRQTADGFQIVSTLLGKPSLMWVKHPWVNRFGKKPIYNIRVKNKVVANTYKKTLVDYKGKMWCPSVENGTIIVRRNGIVGITGNTWNRIKVASTPFYIPLSGHCWLAVKRTEFFERGGYPQAQRVYGGGEPYLDTVYWMTGGTSMCDPGSLVYHLSAGRGYSWHSNDLLHNMFLVSYVLGGKRWADRIKITYLNKMGSNANIIDILYDEAVYEGEEDRKRLEEKRIMTFEELLRLDWVNDCDKCTKRGYAEPHPMREWDKRNEQLHGTHRSYVQEFKLERREDKVFIGETEITDKRALEMASLYI